MNNQHPITTLPCCEAWEDWLESVAWFTDIEGTCRMPHLQDIYHPFNYCPSCGTKQRSVHDLKRLRTARRPKPTSLKEQALAALNVIEDKMLGPTTEEILIRKALEALPND
jgi:hypothetical protein